MPKITDKAIQEIKDNSLDENAEYVNALSYYFDKYDELPPAKTPANKNMLKALRMMKYKNTPSDWARLHATEAYLRKQ